MADGRQDPREVLIVAVPETAGSALYGMLDVLSVAGVVWQQLTRTGPGQRLFSVRIVSPRTRAFTCGHGVPVRPAVSTDADPDAPIVILPELWLGPDDTLRGRYPGVTAWIRRRHAAGASIYSACSGAVMLAETGLLDGCEATSHWAFADLFRHQYPAVRFRSEPNLVFADPGGRIVTAGGTTSWHDLALHIIARHGSPGEASRVAQVYLLKWHAEGQLPYTPLLRQRPHGDAVVREAEAWLAEHFAESDAIARAIARAAIPERTFKRRFKAATGIAPIAHVQNLRIEAAKRLLESGRTPVDEISARVGYEDASFFRRLFRRRTGVGPRDYRRLFRPAEPPPSAVPPPRGRPVAREGERGSAGVAG